MKWVAVAVLVVLVSAVGCAQAQPPGGPGAEGTPVAVDSFTADPPAIAVGESSTLSWDVSGAESIVIDNGVGLVSATGTATVRPTATTAYTLVAVSTGGEEVAATAQVLVSKTSSLTPGAPVIDSFVANPPQVSSGNPSMLSWTVSNANSVTITPTGGTFAPVGSKTVLPSITTTYTLAAMNETGTTTATVTIGVS